MLEQVAPSPAVTLSRAVAVAMCDGAPAGLAIVDGLLDDDTMSGTTGPTPYALTCWRWPAVRPRRSRPTGPRPG